MWLSAVSTPANILGWSKTTQGFDLLVVVALDVVTHGLRQVQVDPANLLQDQVVTDHLLRLR